MANLLRKWRSRPFCVDTPTPGKRVGSKTQAKFCRHCGSVFILGGDLLRQSASQKNAFCDIECANEYKRYHNKSESYQQLTGILGREQRQQAKECRKLRLHAGWKCCMECGKAFHASWNIITCSKVCSVNRNRRINRSRSKQKYGEELQQRWAVCLYCKTLFSYRQHASKCKRRKFCTEGCGRRAAKQRRRHWARANGKSEYISLDQIVRKHGGVCCSCGCITTRHSGRYKPTDATIDHIVPLSKGGLHVNGNVQLMCHLCNSIKGDSID